MEWFEARNKINQRITLNTKLDEDSAYRSVVKTPPYTFTRGKFKGLEGYKVQIGERSHVNIPIEMLQHLFNASKQNNNVYNNEIFNATYPKIGQHDSGHPCYIHCVGKIFEISGIAIKNGNNYKLR